VEHTLPNRKGKCALSALPAHRRSGGAPANRPEGRTWQSFMPRCLWPGVPEKLYMQALEKSIESNE